MNRKTQSKSIDRSRSLADLDELLSFARRRLEHLKGERFREAVRGLDRLLHPRGQPGALGDRLWRRLDEIVHSAERHLARLEDERASVMLEALLPEVKG